MWKYILSRLPIVFLGILWTFCYNRGSNIAASIIALITGIVIGIGVEDD